MESAKTVHQLRRPANPGEDSDQLQPANGIQERAGTLLQAVGGRDGVPGIRSGTGSFGRPELEENAQPLSIGPEPRGPRARAAILFFFMSIVFLSGIFIGASLIPALPGRTPPAGIAISLPAAPPIETPTLRPATTGSDSASQAATLTVDLHPEAALAPKEMVPAQPPQSPPPGVTADAPPTPADTVGASPIPAETPAAQAPGSPPRPSDLSAPDRASAAGSERPGGVAGEPTTTPPIPSETLASTPSPIAPAQTPAPVATGPVLSAEQRQALLARGDTFLAAGDVTSARLFYQRGADAGDGTAALRLGATFDAAFLERAHLGRVPSDPTKAASWYGRARDLGNAEAAILLKSLPAN